MGLHADETEDDMDAGFLHDAGPFNIGGFVEAGFEFDDSGHLFPIGGGFDEGGDDGAVAAGAVEGLLDRQDAGIFGGFADKIEDAMEAFVGMMEEDVLTADGGEEIALVAERGGAGGDVRFEFEFGAVELGNDGEEADEIDRAIDLVEIFAFEFEDFEEAVGDADRAIGLDFQADRVAAVAVAQFGFDAAEEVFGFFLVDVEVAVAGDAELVSSAEFHAMEECTDVMLDDVADPDKFGGVPGARDGDDAGEDAGDLDDGEFGLFFVVFEFDNDVQAFVEEDGEGVDGIDGEGGEDGVDFIAEVILQVSEIIGGDIGVGEEADIFFFEGGEEGIAPAGVLFGHHELDAGGDGRELIGGGHPVGPDFG